jgi:hypothetical protein
MTEVEQTTQDEIVFLKERIADSQRKIDDILRRHGTGVRASWVSTDIAIEQARITDALKAIKELTA